MDFPTIPGYKIEKVLGQGGMACVYLAIQENFERHVALKVMAEHLIRDESFAKRFLREARTVARLSHQSIVPVFDVGAVGNIHYMAMEFLPGGDLKHKMRAGLSLLDSLRIVRAIAAGLNYAGNKGLVHRDIKPENILFREDGSPVISDFGIVRDTDSKTNMTVTGAVIGTPHYMSPEQAEGIAVDPRSDLYSLGVILYEMLTGHVPFTGESAVSIGIKHITEMPEDLPQEVAGFQQLIDTILAKHPEDRYQTGEEFANALADLESNLSDAGAKTVVMSREDIRSSRGKQTGRTAARTSARRTGARTRAKSTVMRRPADEGRGKSLFVASALSVAIALAAAGGVWYWTSQDGSSGQTSTTQIEDLDPVLKTKTDELIAQAKQAITEKRLYEPLNDNAQHYLTTLLALFPDHPEGKLEIENLFSLYIGQAKAAMEANDLASATSVLNQASQISFYISTPSLQEDFANMHRSINNLRQKALISQEKQRLIDDLLAKADQALKDDALTAPADNNAYDLYQQVLVEDENNLLAKQGLVNIAARFLDKAQDQAKNKSFGLAKAFVAAAVQVNAEHPRIEQVQETILKLEEEEAKRQLASENQKIAELEKARKARELAQKQKQKQISDWLKAADIAFKDNRLTSPEEGNALSYYEKVLEEEPANIQALQGKEKVGSRFIEMARTEIKANKFELAEKYLESASAIVSSNVEVARAHRELEAQKEIKKVNDIIKQGDKALAADKLMQPKNDNAIHYYELALSEDPANVKAQQGRERVGMRFIELAKQAIDSKKFDSAEQHLSSAREISTSVVEIEVATNMLNQAKLALKSEEERKKAIAEQKRIDAEKKKAEEARRKLSRTEKLLADARTISRRKASSENNAKLRSIYQDVLKTSSKNRTALAGLTKTSDYEAKQANSAIASRNFSKALQHIAMISATTPNYKGLADLRTKLSDTQAVHDKATTLLSTASGLISKPYEKPGIFGSNKGARNTLSRAYSSIDQARKTDPKHPELSKALTSLEEKYVAIVNFLVNEGDYDDAKDFIRDASNYQWSGKLIASAKDRVDKQAEATQRNAPKAVGGF